MRQESDDELWRYNCEDTVRTLECADVELSNIEKYKLQEVEKFQQSMFWPLLQCMQRGVRIDLEARREMDATLEAEMIKRQEWFKNVLGHELNPRSPQQMQALFYEDLRLPIQYKKTPDGPRPTLDDDALMAIQAKEPLVRPLVKTIQEYRSLGVFLSTFVRARLDEDNRMRCSYNPCGTRVYRLASKENAFGSGTNLQNIPKGAKAKEPEDLELPNIRKIFIPDEGFTFFDLDLQRADLWPVAWEANDVELKLALNLGVDMHCFNACTIYDIKGIPPEELVEESEQYPNGHPNYKEHRARIGYTKRQNAKVGAHAVDYYCQSRKLAQALGCSVHEADHFIRKWLGSHPGIEKWQHRTIKQVNEHRFVENKYGYRCYFFDRPESVIPEALAWVPASTVAVTINKAWHNIYSTLPEVWVLLQVHDSLAGQVPTHLLETLKPKMLQQARITIPYEDPLVIPIGIKTSEKSWGDCE